MGASDDDVAAAVDLCARTRHAGPGETLHGSWKIRAGTAGNTALAEGVETFDQLDTLTKLGCSYVQGFHIARSQPAIDLTAPLAQV